MEYFVKENTNIELWPHILSSLQYSAQLYIHFRTLPDQSAMHAHKYSIKSLVHDNLVSRFQTYETRNAKQKSAREFLKIK